MTAEKVMIADNDDSERRKISAALQKISVDMEITEVKEIQKVFMILALNAHFDTVIISLNLMGNNWRYYAKKVQAICHNIKIIYITYNRTDKVSDFLLNTGCFSCISGMCSDEVFFHLFWLLLNDCPYIPVSFSKK
jgi:DNA-binding NarL/FixJ family response regulator